MVVPQNTKHRAVISAGNTPPRHLPKRNESMSHKNLHMNVQRGITHHSQKKWSEVNSLSRVRLFATPWTVAHQAPPSMGFSRQEYCSGLPFPSPGDLPNPGIEPKSPTWQEDALSSEPPGNTEKGKAIPFSIFAWRIPWTEEPGRLYSPWGCRVRYD